MAGAKRFAQLAKKWQRVEALGRKRLTVTAKEDEGSCTSVTSKGYCVVYTADGRRFEVPLVYLSTTVFGELLRMSQEEFGFASDSKITLPCDAAVMEYVMSLLRRNASADIENALLSSMFTWFSSKSVEETEGPCGMSCSSVAGKGYCITYTADGTRFAVPLAFLGTTVFRELLRMSQEEFGFAGADGGRITLPCDASVMKYVMCMLRRSASAEMEAAFVRSMATPCHYHAEPHQGVSHHLGICSH